MGADSKIEWTDHTFNPWAGCTKVSPGCDNCYAEAWSKRSGLVKWGPHADRRRTSASNWKQPLKWHHDSARLHCHGVYTGRRSRVFCASLADVFDNAAPQEWREDLWKLIADTPHLDWLLLTKRPQNITKMSPFSRPGHFAWPNVWLGTTVENQEEANRRIPHLLAVRAAVRFLSCEPLLGTLDLSDHIICKGCPGCGSNDCWAPGVNWVICGGESGPGKRPMNLQWARGLRDQCANAGVRFFMKQIDKVQPVPDDLMVRQFPET